MVMSCTGCAIFFLPDHMVYISKSDRVICCMSLKIGLFMFLRISISIFSLPQFYMPFFSPGSKLPLKLTLLHVLSDRPLIMLMVLQSIFIIIFVFS